MDVMFSEPINRRTHARGGLFSSSTFPFDVFSAVLSMSVCVRRGNFMFHFDREPQSAAHGSASKLKVKGRCRIFAFAWKRKSPEGAVQAASDLWFQSETPVCVLHDWLILISRAVFISIKLNPTENSCRHGEEASAADGKRQIPSSSLHMRQFQAAT